MRTRQQSSRGAVREGPGRNVLNSTRVLRKPLAGSSFLFREKIMGLKVRMKPDMGPVNISNIHSLQILKHQDFEGSLTFFSLYMSTNSAFAE